MWESCSPFSQHLPLFIIALSTFYSPQNTPTHIFSITTQKCSVNQTKGKKNKEIGKNKWICEAIAVLRNWDVNRMHLSIMLSLIMTSFITMAIDSSSTVLLRCPDENEVYVCLRDSLTNVHMTKLLSALYSNPVEREMHFWKHLTIFLSQPILLFCNSVCFITTFCFFNRLNEKPHWIYRTNLLI